MTSNRPLCCRICRKEDVCAINDFGVCAYTMSHDLGEYHRLVQQLILGRSRFERYFFARFHIQTFEELLSRIGPRCDSKFWSPRSSAHAARRFAAFCLKASLDVTYLTACLAATHLAYTGEPLDNNRSFRCDRVVLLGRIASIRCGLLQPMCCGLSVCHNRWLC